MKRIRGGVRRRELDLQTLVWTRGAGATIHKSQGSEYPAVVIPVMTQHYTMLQRNLLYTGVTRGKKLVVLVGQKKAVAIAVRSISGRRRGSKLREWLAEPKGEGRGPSPARSGDPRACFEQGDGKKKADRGGEVPWPAGRGLDGGWRYGRLAEETEG